MSSTVASPGSFSSAALWDGLRRFAALPGWLEAALRLDLLSAAATRQIPELAAGELALVGCDLERLRAKRGYWTGLYRLTVAPPDGDPRQVEVDGRLYPPGALPPGPDQPELPLGADGWRCRLPELGMELHAVPADRAATLPALPLLTDPAAARELLERTISAASPGYAELRIAACTPRVVRHKPPNRATILYRLEYPSGTEAAARGWPALVVAKTFRADKGDRGASAWEGMRSLWQSPLAKGDTPTIAEPLGYLPELPMLLQGPVGQERTLKELMRDALDAGTPDALAEMDTYLDKTAVGLAALHASGASIGRPVTLDDKLAELHEVAGILAANVPALAGAADALLAKLEELAARYPADPPVPSHGAFRPAQVLVHQGRVGFVDFDTACQAEPARDLGLFLAAVKDVGLTRKAEAGAPEPPRAAQLATYDQLAGLCEAFLARYQETAAVSPARLLLCETAEILNYALSCWHKVKPEKLAANMLMLERQVTGPLARWS